MATRTEAKPTHPPVTEDVVDPAYQPGDPVKVQGKRGKFVFVGRRRHLRTGAEWLDVWGGPSGREAARSYDPELVSPVPRKKSRRNGIG